MLELLFSFLTHTLFSHFIDLNIKNSFIYIKDLCAKKTWNVSPGHVSDTSVMKNSNPLVCYLKSEIKLNLIIF